MYIRPGQLAIFLGAVLLLFELWSDAQVAINLWQDGLQGLSMGYVTLIYLAALGEAVLIVGRASWWQFCLTTLRVQFLPDTLAAFLRYKRASLCITLELIRPLGQHMRLSIHSLLSQHSLH